MKLFAQLIVMSVVTSFSFNVLAQGNDSSSEYKKTIEFRIINFNGSQEHVKSDEAFGDIISFDVKNKKSGIKTIPLEFRFELENKSWGALTDIDFKNNEADIGLYQVINDFKFGLGLIVSYEHEENRIEIKKKQVTKLDTVSRQISPYFLLKKTIAEDYTYSFEYWGKAGAEFSSKKSNDVEFKSIAFYLIPGFDLFFNVTRSLSLGSGASIKYSILNGTVNNYESKVDGSGTAVSYQLGLLKLKYVF